MKILLVANSVYSMVNFRGGVIRAMVEAGHTVLIAAPSDNYVDDVVRLGAQHVDLSYSSGSRNPLSDLALLAKLHSMYRSIRPDLVFQYTIKPNIYGSIAAMLLGIRAIAVVPGLGYAFGNAFFTGLIAKTLYRLAFIRIGEVWFLNSEDRDEFVKLGLVSETKTRALSGEGIDLDHFKPLHQDRRGPEVKFLYLGRLLPEKGVREYVEAARRIREKRTDVRFCLMGMLDRENPTAIRRSELDQWIEADAIEYLKPEKNVRPVLESCDCIVLPSYYREGVPRALLEGAAMKKLLVAADNVGSRAIVIDNVTGFVCSPRSIESLEAAMMKVIELPERQRFQMGEIARRLVEEKYSEDIIVETYMRAVERMRSGPLNAHYSFFP